MQTQEFKEQLNIIAEDIGNLPEPCRVSLMANQVHRNMI